MLKDSVAARFLVLAAMLLSALVALLPMARAMSQPMSAAADVIPVNVAADCQAPAHKKQSCQVDCLLCHALALSAMAQGTVRIGYVTERPAIPSAWIGWTAEIDPPVPRSVC